MKQKKEKNVIVEGRREGRRDDERKETMRISIQNDTIYELESVHAAGLVREEGRRAKKMVGSFLLVEEIDQGQKKKLLNWGRSGNTLNSQKGKGGQYLKLSCLYYLLTDDGAAYVHVCGCWLSSGGDAPGCSLWML